MENLKIPVDSPIQLKLVTPYYDKDNKTVAIPLIINDTVFRIDIPRNAILKCINSFPEMYKSEYNSNDKSQIVLPLPECLNMIQKTQLLNAAIHYADAITNIVMMDMDEPYLTRSRFKKKIIEKIIPSYIRNELIFDNDTDKEEE
jgi:hypothetical protein